MGPTVVMPLPDSMAGQYPHAFLTAFAPSLHMDILPSNLSDIVADNEDLARFLTSSGQFNSTMVKHSAFLPNPKDHATSVFRHGVFPADSLWRIGLEHAAIGRTLHGAAICKTWHVRAAKLEVRAKEPPPRHADIVGWPVQLADPEMEKAQQKELAILIAQYAQLVRR